MCGEASLRHVRRCQTAEVDDPAYTGLASLLGEDLCSGAIGSLEAGAGVEGVHQVVGDIDTLHGRGDRVGVTDVTLDGFDVVCPGMIPELFSGANHATNPMTGPQESRNEAAANVSGCSRHQTEQPFSVLL